MTCEAGTMPDLDRVKLIVDNHIVRFGWRENLGIEWTER